VREVFMAKNNKKNTKVKPNYVAHASVWLACIRNWYVIFLMLLGIIGFAYLQFVYLPTAEGDIVETLGIVSYVCLAVGIVCLIIQIWLIFYALYHRFEFYDNRVVEKIGIIFKTEEIQGVFIGIYTVYVVQSFWGKIFNYGDVIVDYPGYWNLKTDGLAAPHRLKKYLETKITKNGLHAIVSNTTPYWY
jgi:hypothetical protein